MEFCQSEKVGTLVKYRETETKLNDHLIFYIRLCSSKNLSKLTMDTFKISQEKK